MTQPYLETSIFELLPMMNRPSRPLRVVVVDDCENTTRGVEEILGSWPNINLRTLVPSANTLPIDGVDTSDDIILLNGPKKQITSDEMAAALEEKGFFGLIASITDGEKSAWSAHHFNKKSEVLADATVALDFVLWMNCLIKQIETAKLR